MDKIELIEKKKLIGQGGVSKVYQCRIKGFQNENIVVLKIGSNTNNNVKNYEIIKSLNLPTLDFLKQVEYDGRIVLVAQHINLSKRIYVTPNSLISDSMKLLNDLNKYLPEKRKKKKNPIAEDFRYKNKLSEITNFDFFTNSTIEHLKLISDAKVYIEFDSYFLGTIKMNSISDIDYKIADFDHIFKNENEKTEDIFYHNISEFKRVMLNFLKYFVEKGENRYIYEKIINNINIA